jgi:hypothetical protein
MARDLTIPVQVGQEFFYLVQEIDIIHIFTRYRGRQCVYVDIVISKAEI